eukprot:1157123-Pelagomonas_calceolata.AAC.9
MSEAESLGRPACRLACPPEPDTLQSSPSTLFPVAPRKVRQSQPSHQEPDLYDSKNYLVRGGQRAYEQKIQNMNRAAIQDLRAANDALASELLRLRSASEEVRRELRLRVLIKHNHRHVLQQPRSGASLLVCALATERSAKQHMEVCHLGNRGLKAALRVCKIFCAVQGFESLRASNTRLELELRTEQEKLVSKAAWRRHALPPV